jgi:Leucine-rich repeat (LRR) protein
LQARPGHARAEASAKLCDELLAAPANPDGKLSRESHARLHLAMQQQQRPAGELMPVARLLGEERKLVVEYWLARLKDLPVSGSKPLKDRLSVRDDGRLALDLSDTKVNDLSPLVGAPLGELNVSSCKDLTDISPLRGLDLIELNISSTGVADLSPLRDMRSLEKLALYSTRVTHLAALSGLRLRSLNFYQCPITDLSPLKSMALEEISLRQTRVADLSPLIGMPIRSIDLSFTPVINFSPLTKLPLEKCYLESSKITDLSVLSGVPLKELVLLNGQTSRNYAVLSEIKTLELLVLNAWYRNLPAREYAAIGELRKHPNLRQLGAGVFDSLEGSEEAKAKVRSELAYAATGSADAFWKDWDRDQVYLPALRRSGIRFNLHRHVGGHDHLIIYDQPLRDLSILKGAPIAMLTLQGSKVTDLTPLRELKELRFLQLNTDAISDLGPLRGLPLETLILSGAKFIDLSPLEGMPIKSIYLSACKNLSDVSVLASMQALQNVTVPLHAQKIKALRKLPNLERISFNQTEVNVDIALPDTSAAEFWKDYEWIGPLHEAGLTPKLEKHPDGTWFVNLSESAITDLSPFDGAPVSELWLGNTIVADLSPLKNTPLKVLWVYNTRVTDLSPLQGKPITELHMSGTRVTDLSPLRGMPLVNLKMHGCPELTDLSPLSEAKGLVILSLPPKARSFDFLQTFPKLTHVSFVERNGWPDKTPAEFWNENGLAWVKALRDAGIQPKELTQLSDGTWHVSLSDSTIGDLAILKGTPISELALDRTPVTDLKPLKGMAIKKLWLPGTKIDDLGPLRGMPLEVLHLSSTGLTDLSAIRGLPLTELRLSGCKELKDISALSGMPLATLALHDCPELTDLSPLADVKSLTSVTLPPNAKEYEFLRKYKLDRISFKVDAQSGWRPDKTSDDFWKEYDEQGWLRALRDSGVAIRSVKQLPDGTWDLNLASSGISDLTVVKGAPLSTLNLGETAVTDLTPLRGMPLKDLRIFRTRVTDLGPLQGLPLEQLHMSGTNITDLSALRGMPLSFLKLDGCLALTDLAPLADCKQLKNLTLPPNAKDIDFLRAFTRMERLSFRDDPKNGNRPTRTAAQFWREYDGEGWLRKLRDAGVAIKGARQLPDNTWHLDLSDAKISDLTILKDAPVSSLNLVATPATDLSPLRSMPLRHLWLSNMKVADLSALKGLPLETLCLNVTPVTDLSALRGMPLTLVRLNGCAGLTDISVLRGLPLVNLTLHDNTALTDLSPLADCKTLGYLTIPSSAKDYEFLRRMTSIERLAFKEDKKGPTRPDTTAEQFWKNHDEQAQISAAVREAGFTIKGLTRQDDGTLDLDLTGSPIGDLKALAKLPLSVLRLGNTSVADLEPLRGMKLRSFAAFNTKVTDVGPLKGMPLDRLSISGTKVTDLSPLRGMPLTMLRLHSCNELTDLSPLTDCHTLRDLTLPRDAKNIDFLRAVPALARIGYNDDPKNGYRADKTAADFWAEYDANKKPGGK